jgi:hypothetical protein
MRAIAVVCGLLVASMAAVGCDEALSPADEALPCGQGELLLVQGHSYCVFEASVVIETGFSCPEGTLPAEHEEKFICAPPDGLADEALSELSEAIDAMANQLDRPAPLELLHPAGRGAPAARLADGQPRDPVRKDHEP